MALPSIAQLFPAGALAPAAAKTYMQAWLQSMLDNFGDMSSKAAAQKAFGVGVVDAVRSVQTGYNVLTAKIPLDNSIPQIGEGSPFHTVTITPKSATNRLRARFTCQVASNVAGADTAIGALFVNGAADAVADVAFTLATDGAIGELVLEHEWVAGATTAQTIRINIGCGTGSIILGGNRFGALLGDKSRSNLIVEEITA